MATGTRYNDTVHISVALADAMDKIQQAIDEYKKRTQSVIATTDKPIGE